ncbi:shikimate dehydrogenase [Rhizobium sp. S95]|uniref:Shikimate dehydrogenase (NADP(+)) n=1 Tax=Ciceribacter sichuanensis TaxID=2949647 RepID=A0AAJ1BXL4_9HYPH|nr:MULTISPECIES: shikimate dehydrogenase [unclassified Ciceribacter]MCM2396549.1 shikimate dehydrogenase [Ciceribacter sp. S95]MCM2402139.1 shikimate dehydrogenase [Ciceribacter sp. S153]MCO5957300.1 shikimate dehydrogenase [Ciceribacter sp. S101]
MADSRETFVNHAFVVGYPIKHSRSPLIHRHWLKSFGIKGSYERVAVSPENFEAFIAELKSGASVFRGGNVTIPHKEAACRLADLPDALAEELGAANTLWMEEGRLNATNTDGIGFTASLDAGHPGWDNVDRAVILGAGGASRAVVQAVRDRGIREINIVNRSMERAVELADRFGPAIHAHPMSALGEVCEGAGLFINTTSLGMDGEAVDEMPFERLLPSAMVTDIVYVPLMTPILKQAEAKGLATVDGLGMLLHQAVPGFEKWFGRRPVVDEELRNLVIADMEAHA